MGHTSTVIYTMYVSEIRSDVDERGEVFDVDGA